MKNEKNVSAISRRLGVWYCRASVLQRQDGLDWYNTARTDAAGIADRTGIHISKVVGIIAVLSPGSLWSRNLTEAEEFCRLYPDLSGFVSVTYKANVRKASAIMAAGSIENIEKIVLGTSGRKTRSFFWNILEPWKADHVTIDRHILSASGSDKAAPGAPDYRAISKAIKAQAARSGMLPLQYQAIVWTVYRDFKKESQYGKMLF